MSARRWQVVLVTLCVANAIVLAVNVAMVPHIGLVRSLSAHHLGPFEAQVDAVGPNSPLAAAGVRRGDVLDFRSLPAGDRYRWNWLKPAGVPIVLPVRRGATSLPVRLVPDSAAGLLHDWRYWIGVGGEAFSLLFATLISVRRPDAVEARLLALFLLGCWFGIDLAPNNWITPWAAVDLAAGLLSSVCAASALLFFARYVMLFARPPSAIRRWLWTVTVASAVASVALNVAELLGVWTGTLDPNSPPLSSPFTSCIDPSFPALAAAIVAMRESRGLERTRLIWAAVPIGAFILLQVVGNVVAAFAFSASTAVWVAQNGSNVIMPLGLTYSLLNRRLLDVGFALNRAAVFAATSLLLAGLFSALQWAAGSLLNRLSHTHNVMVQLAIAVTVYYLVRLSRHHTDRIVGKVFFGERQRRIAAIRTLTRDVAEVSEAGGVVPFVTSSLSERVGIEASALLPRDDGAFAPAGEAATDAVLDRDDPTLVALLSRREPVPAAAWAGPGATAFPMLVRGRVRGVLTCRFADGDEIAPDESSALLALAHEMGVARDDLLAESFRRQASALGGGASIGSGSSADSAAGAGPLRSPA